MWRPCVSGSSVETLISPLTAAALELCSSLTHKVAVKFSISRLSDPGTHV